MRPVWRAKVDHQGDITTVFAAAFQLVQLHCNQGSQICVYPKHFRRLFLDPPKFLSAYPEGKSLHHESPAKKCFVYEPLYETYTIHILTVHGYMGFCTNHIRHRIRHRMRHRIRHHTVRVCINRIPFIYGFHIWLPILHMNGIPIVYGPYKVFVHICIYTNNIRRRIRYRAWSVYRSYSHMKRNRTRYRIRRRILFVYIHI